jgi:hypothetical protein
MNSYDYIKMIELSEDSLYIAQTLIDNKIPILSFANVCDANYLHCYAGTIEDLIEYTEANKVVLINANKTHRSMYIPFSNGYEKFKITENNSWQKKLKYMELQLLPTQYIFDSLNIQNLWHKYQTRQRLETGAS